MAYERMLDKAYQPTDQEMLEAIHDVSLWVQMRDYLAVAYDISPELINYGNYGWTLRYRKSGRTLCSLYPERGAFSMLIVLGKKIVDNQIAEAWDIPAVHTRRLVIQVADLTS